MPESLKQKIIRFSEQFFLLRIFLFMLLFFNKSVRKEHISRLRIVLVFCLYLFKIIINSFVFFFLHIINVFRESSFGLGLRKKILKSLAIKAKYKEVDLPENIKKTDIHHFKNRNYFIDIPAKFKTPKNVHVYLATDFGIVFKNLNICLNSIHGRLDKRNLKILKPYYEIIFDNYINKSFHKNHEIIYKNKDKKYFLIHHWFNYFHWFTESMHRFFSKDIDLSGYVLVLPETLKSYEFVVTSLKAFPGLTVEYFPNHSILYFEELHYVTQKKYCSHYNRDVLLKIKRHFVSFMKSHSVKPPLNNDKIFISRKNSKRRGIVNESEVYNLLNNYGFSIIDFEDLSFLEQVSLMQNVKYLVGVHGAGLTNMLWMPEDGSIFELHRLPANKTEHFSLVYWRMTKRLNFRYLCQLCPAVHNPMTGIKKRKNYFNYDLNTYNITVDMCQFEENIRVMLNLKI